MLAISLITDIDPNLILKLENQKKVNNYLMKKFKNEQNIKEFLNSFYIKEMIKLNWFKPKNITSYVQTSIDLLEYLKIKDFDEKLQEMSPALQDIQKLEFQTGMAMLADLDREIDESTKLSKELLEKRYKKFRVM